MIKNLILSIQTLLAIVCVVYFDSLKGVSPFVGYRCYFLMVSIAQVTASANPGRFIVCYLKKSDKGTRRMSMPAFRSLRLIQQRRPKYRQKCFLIKRESIAGLASAVEELQTTEREDPGSTPDEGL
jgi:hypothetical protein